MREITFIVTQNWIEDADIDKIGLKFVTFRYFRMKIKTL